MKRSKSLTIKLNNCDIELKLYALELESINAKLRQQNAKLEAANIDYQNEIKALKQLSPKHKVVIRNFILPDDECKKQKNEK